MANMYSFYTPRSSTRGPSNNSSLNDNGDYGGIPPGPQKGSMKNSSTESPTSIFSMGNNGTAKRSFTDFGHKIIRDLISERSAKESLFMLIEKLEWKKALIEVVRNGKSATEWLSNNDEVRRLPIHEVCIRQPPTQLVSLLIEKYPEGAREQDSQGRTALHHACIHGASVDVIHVLLHHNREAANTKDMWEETPKGYALSNASPDIQIIQALFHKSRRDIASYVSRIKTASPTNMHENSSHSERSTPPMLIEYPNTQHGAMVEYEESGGQIVPFSHLSASPSSSTHLVQRETRTANSRTYGNSSDKGRVLAERDVAMYNVQKLQTKVDYLQNRVEEGKKNESLIAQAQAEADAACAQRDIAYATVDRFQDKIFELENELKESEELKWLLASSQKELEEAQSQKDNALLEAHKLRQELFNAKKVSESSKYYVGLKNKEADNDMLRDINKDLRQTIQELTVKLNNQVTLSPQVEDEQAKMNREYNKFAVKRIDELQKKLAQAEEETESTKKELTVLNTAYFDVKTKLLQKSRLEKKVF